MSSYNNEEDYKLPIMFIGKETQYSSTRIFKNDAIRKKLLGWLVVFVVKLDE